MLEFALACILLIITPGPGVLSVAGIGAGFGYKAGSKYLWGLCFGNIMVALAVISGLSVLIFSIPVMRTILLVLSTLYLLYLAAKIAFAGSKIGFIEAKEAPRLIDGIALQAINPKAYVANTVLFSGYNFLPDALPLEVSLKLIIWICIWIPIHFSWLLAGIGMRHLDLSVKKQRAINYVMATSMVGVILLAYAGFFSE